MSIMKFSPVIIEPANHSAQRSRFTEYVIV
ncbi:Protein of unknown function [Pyronema omphalodes CBS 100304]|uniref:Uncharacterized protein n=1 Tax=Pyronema omphalodes (strain CBS 100304) TaxID=1076935 RepID=U4KWB1_PYROM|nr:Protein of unknown function [Pyronema omphalodes CBS 100304]